MIQSENITVKISQLSHEGRGIGEHNGKKVFVEGALPDEIIDCRISRKRERFIEAQLNAIIHASKSRTTPSCEHFSICGGCSLQHMSTEMQLDLKLNSLLNQLQHFGRVTPENIISPLTANENGYRRKARLGVRYVYKKQKLLIGFREKNSRYLADLNTCEVLHPSIGKQLPKIAELITNLSCYTEIPQIEVAIGDEATAMVIRCMKDLNDDDAYKLKQFGQAQDFHIFVQPDPPGDLIKIWPQDNNFFLHYRLPDNDLDFYFHPLDFTQINLELNRLMVNQAIAFLDLSRQDSVLDLFCGLGNFTLPIAKRAGNVIGVEGNEAMISRAKMNAQHNHIMNVSFYQADLFSAMPTDDEWFSQHYNKILLDPPRTGAQAILPHLKRFGANKIVYVSCNPATFARDAGEIVHQLNFKFTHVGVMNMFPHTSHIEAMGVFEK